MDRDRTAGKACRQHGVYRLRARRGLRISASRRALRKLAAAARCHLDCSDVRACRDDWRHLSRVGSQYSGRDRPCRACWPRRQERHPYRRIRQTGGGARKDTIRGRGVGCPDEAAPNSHDFFRLHSGRAPAGGRARCRGRDASIAWDRGFRRHARGDFLWTCVYANLLCPRSLAFVASATTHKLGRRKASTARPCGTLIDRS